ncbi:hypothetical protein GIB67_008332, partial [Kingdonia uniflora]
GPQHLSLSIRIKVVIGAAKEDFNLKLSDFGLDKAGPTGDRTYVSIQVMDTQRYAAPEYVLTGT